MALLCLATLACWIPQFRFFWLPNNDYATFEAWRAASAGSSCRRNFQRLPLLPAAMALLAPLLPGRHPELDAALLLNLAFALATLPLLYALRGAQPRPRGAARARALRRHALSSTAQALQPLVEPSLSFFVVLAFVLFQRRSAWQYAAAGAAALSRYEAAALLPIFAAANALRGPALAAARRARRRSRARPSCAGSALGALRGSGAAFYAADMERMGFSPAPHVLRDAAEGELPRLVERRAGPRPPALPASPRRCRRRSGSASACGASARDTAVAARATSPRASR